MEWSPGYDLREARERDMVRMIGSVCPENQSESQCREMCVCVCRLNGSSDGKSNALSFGSSSLSLFRLLFRCLFSLFCETIEPSNSLSIITRLSLSLLLLSLGKGRHDSDVRESCPQDA